MAGRGHQGAQFPFNGQSVLIRKVQSRREKPQGAILAGAKPGYDFDRFRQCRPSFRSRPVGSGACGRLQTGRTTVVSACPLSHPEHGNTQTQEIAEIKKQMVVLKQPADSQETEQQKIRQEMHDLREGVPT